MNNIEKFFSKDPVSFAGSYINYLNRVLAAIDIKEIGHFIETLLNAREQGAMIFFLVMEEARQQQAILQTISRSVPVHSKSLFRAISLTDNNAVITAIANDYGYDDIFVQQLKVLAKKGDVVVGISASGNSPNLLRAFEYARTAGIKTVSLTAFDGGKLKMMADEGIHVPTEPKEYGPAEDAHMMIDHLVGAYLINLVNSGG